MPVLAIADGVFEVGAAHPERQLFDCLMPTPYGTTYNSYLVIGSEKTALIDAVDPEKVHVLMKNLREAGVEHIDYLICLHTEQDHSGGNAEFLRRFPQAEVIATTKVRDLMATHIHQDPAKVRVIAEGDKIELGDCTLVCYPIPFAHWPDNTMLWLEQEKILFSTDLFGSHFSTSKAFSTSSSQLQLAAKSYYSEIMMPFRSHIAKYTAKTRELQPRMIAPAHGPVWYDPELILSKYEQWTGDTVKKRVTIPYVSMHDSTRRMVEHLTIKLSQRGISVICHDLGSAPESLTIETGHFINDLVDAAAVIFAVPTLLGGPHPAAVYAAVIASAMKPKAPLLGLIGSYGWGSRMPEVMESLLTGFKSERLPVFQVKGLPEESELEALTEYADSLADKVLALPNLAR